MPLCSVLSVKESEELPLQLHFLVPLSHEWIIQGGTWQVFQPCSYWSFWRLSHKYMQHWCWSQIDLLFWHEDAVHAFQSAEPVFFKSLSSCIRLCCFWFLQSPVSVLWGCIAERIQMSSLIMLRMWRGVGVKPPPLISLLCALLRTVTTMQLSNFILKIFFLLGLALY